MTNKVFAIDGAVSLAGTGHSFGNDASPNTSRTVQGISQTTVTQREVNSNPDVPDLGVSNGLGGCHFFGPVGTRPKFAGFGEMVPVPVRDVGPINDLESVSINKTAARLVAGRSTA